jgi:hypothetical protein
MQGRVRLDVERGPDAGSHSYGDKGASCRVAKNISQLHGHVQTGRDHQQGRSSLYEGLATGGVITWGEMTS